MENRNFLLHPSKKIFLIFSTLWFIGASLLVMAMSDLFTESIFQRQNTMVLILLLASTVILSTIGYNYFVNKKRN